MSNQNRFLPSTDLEHVPKFYFFSNTPSETPHFQKITPTEAIKLGILTQQDIEEMIVEADKWVDDNSYRDFLEVSANVLDYNRKLFVKYPNSGACFNICKEYVLS